MKSLLTKNWNLMRLLRLVTGIGEVIYAAISRDLVLGIAGVFLVLLGFFNVGCCCTGTCRLPQRPRR